MKRIQEAVEQQIVVTGCEQEADVSLRHEEPLPAADRPYARERFSEIYSTIWGYYRSLDDGKVDFRVAQVMAMEGYTHEEICDAMYHRSSEIEIRKGNGWFDYIESTVRSAMRSAEK